MRPGSNPKFGEHLHHGAVQGVVKHLGRRPPRMTLRHGSRIGQVAAVNDSAAAAGPPHERHATDRFHLPGVTDLLEPAE